MSLVSWYSFCTVPCSALWNSVKLLARPTYLYSMSGLCASRQCTTVQNIAELVAAAMQSTVKNTLRMLSHPLLMPPWSFVASKSQQSFRLSDSWPGVLFIDKHFQLKSLFVDVRYGTVLLNNFAAVWPRDGLLHGGNDVDRAEGGGVYGGGDSLLPRLPQPCLQVTSVPKAIKSFSTVISPALPLYNVVDPHWFPCGSGSSILGQCWSGTISGSGSRVLIKNFKILQMKKIAVYLSPGLREGQPSYRRSLQPPKENI